MPADPKGSPAVLRPPEKGGAAGSDRTIWKGPVRPHGADVPRQMPGGAGAGSAGKSNPCQPGGGLQAAAQAWAGDAGAVVPGAPALPHAGPGGGILRAVPAGSVYWTAPGRTAGPAMVRPGSGYRNAVRDQAGL